VKIGRGGPKSPRRPKRTDLTLSSQTAFHSLTAGQGPTTGEPSNDIGALVSKRVKRQRRRGVFVQKNRRTVKIALEFRRSSYERVGDCRGSFAVVSSRPRNGTCRSRTRKKLPWITSSTADLSASLKAVSRSTLDTEAKESRDPTGSKRRRDRMVKRCQKKVRAKVSLREKTHHSRQRHRQKV